ncbi:thioredoxin domain-containing protein [Patescibacteria group bacterium]|nr:thioredoxin domain-containing protein [Patescibacteria group bacterium]
MHRKQIILIALLVIIMLSISGWMIFRGVHLAQNSFLTGKPPENMLEALVPQTIDPAKMHPPAVRPADPVRYGNVTSSATVIVFGDFECASCAELVTTLNTIIPTYNGKVRLVWRDLPITEQHSNAMNAAVLARCAHTQGQFWQAHDALFQTTKLNSFTLQTIINRLNLNKAAFSACQSDPKIRQAIELDVKTAAADGIQTTPFIFIGTKAINGSITADQLKKEIDLFLKS